MPSRVKRIAVLSARRERAEALCHRLLRFCLAHGAYYEFTPWEHPRQPEAGDHATGYVLLPDAREAAQSLRASGAEGPIVLLHADEPIDAEWFAYDRVFCLSTQEEAAILARVLGKPLLSCGDPKASPIL